MLSRTLGSHGGDHNTLTRTLLFAQRISWDGDKARALLDAADRYSNDPVVKAALRKAVESLHSNGDYRTLMSRIGRHEASL